MWNQPGRRAFARLHQPTNQPKRTDASTAAAVAVAAPFAAEPLPPAALADFQPSSPPLEAGVAVDAGDGVTGTGGGASAPAPPAAFVAGGGVAGGAPLLSFLSPPLPPPPPLQQSHRQKSTTGRQVSLVELEQPRAHAFPLKHMHTISLLDRVRAQRSSSTRDKPSPQRGARNDKAKAKAKAKPDISQHVLPPLKASRALNVTSA